MLLHQSFSVFSQLSLPLTLEDSLNFDSDFSLKLFALYLGLLAARPFVGDLEARIVLLYACALLYVW